MNINKKDLPGNFVIEIPEGATALVLEEDGEEFLKLSYHTNTLLDTSQPFARTFCAAVGLGRILETDLKLVETKFKETQDEHKKANNN